MRLADAVILSVSLAMDPGHVAGWQQQRIAGVVVDSAGRAIEAAEVRADGSTAIIRTDATGRFTITVPAFPATLRMRALGFASTVVEVPPGEREGPIRVTMPRVSQQLDTVAVYDQNDCPGTSIAGFECRRRAGRGIYRDAGEIRALKPFHWADMLEGMPGLRRVASRGPHGGDFRVAPVPSRCLVELWNGQAAMKAVGAPYPPDSYWLPTDVVAIEYYDTYDKVPATYRALAWPEPPSEKCGLIIYWLRGARRR